MEMKKYRLDEVATIKISGVDKKTKDNETPVKLCNFTDVYYNWAITKEMADSFMSASANQKEIETLTLKKGQVAFTKDSETRDDIGIPTYIADDFENVILGYHTALATPNKKKLSGKYLNAFMNTKYIQKYFENNASGSGQRYTLSNETLNAIPIIAPDLPIQKKIGNVFSNIDRKIAVNRRINAKLEQMAKRLYDRWFIQFDFPDNDGKPYKASGGKMIRNETLKREIPAGWEVKRLCNFAKYVDNTDSAEMIVNYISTDNMLPNKDGITDIISKPSKGNFVRYEKYDILISNIRPYFKKIWFSNQTGNCSTDVLCIRSKEQTRAFFIYRCLWQDEFFDYVMKGAKGSKMPRGDKTRIMNYSFAYPVNSKEIIERFNSLFTPLQEALWKNKKETAKLIILREHLLPLLMNGQVEVK